MKPSTFFSVALAVIAGVSARPGDIPVGMSTSIATPNLSSSSSTVAIPKSTPTPGVGGSPVLPSSSQDIGSRGTNCSGSKESACCDKVKGLCNVLVENKACPTSSMYCCDFSGNVSNFWLLLDFSLLPLLSRLEELTHGYFFQKGIQVNILSCSQVIV